MPPRKPRGVERRSRAETQAQTRRALLDAAEVVFLRRGLRGSSVEEISAEAGYTRGAFYSNFEGKQQLFVELLQDRVYVLYRDLINTQPEVSGDPPRAPPDRRPPPARHPGEPGRSLAVQALA